MNDFDQHPEPEILSAFGLGQLIGGDARGVERHLTVCASCRSTVDEVAADSFVTLLRVARRSEADPQLRETVAEGSVSTAPNPAIPPALAKHSKYRVLELLGAGGMGAVYRAEHQLMERTVALKVIKRSLTDNPSMVERFRREVKAAARLTHPNIVTAYDADQVEDTHFLVMEYVEGVSLARLVAEKGRLPVAQACDCVRQAALAMQHAYEKGMVHRDIKPQNLMRTPDGQVKVLDFGLARFAMETTPAGALLAEAAQPGGDSLTQVGTVVGTPDYIAPEQARDASTADIRADIYSLGCTLYDLLAGEAPFPEGTAVQKVLAHLERTPRPLRQLRPDVPPGLVRVVERMMAKDPARRYQTPAEVVKALTPFLSQPRRVTLRRAAWIMASAAAMLLLMVGVVMNLRSRLALPDPAPYVPPKAGAPEVPGPLIPVKWDKPSQPTLALDTGGHTAPVVAALFTPDGAHLITAALDNTVRIWDVAGGESLRVLRPPLGPDGVGRLTAAALSPDGSLLAVGGHTTPEQDEARGVIYLISLPFGRLEYVLPTARTGGLRALAFSPKGDRLAATAANDVVVWDVKTRQPERVLSRHIDDVTDLAFDPAGGRLATASRDRTVRLWPLSGSDPSTLGHDHPVSSVAWSPDGTMIAAGGGDDPCVSVWFDTTADGRLEAKIRALPPAERGRRSGGYLQRLLSRKQLDLPAGGKTWIGSLGFARDSGELFVSWAVGLSEDDYAERGGTLLDLATGASRPGYRSRGYFRGVRGAMSADGRHAVTTGGNDHEVALWRSGDGELLRFLRGQGRTPLRVGWEPDGWMLGYGYAGPDGSVSKQRPLQRAFDLAAQRFVAQPDLDAFQREQHTRGEMLLEIPPDGAHAAVRWDTAARTSFSWNSNGEKWGLNAVVPVEYRRLVRCGTVLPGGRVLVGGDLGLYVHNVLKQSREDRFWQGCGESAWSLAARPNGRHVLAAHGDQTLRIWDPSQERPLLSLFIADNEWVVWTQEGYYATSPGGERFLGWQVGEGPATLCSFYGIAQFRKSLHRPDVIAHLLQSGTVAKAVQMADRDQGRKTQTVAVNHVLPPRVALLAPDRKRLDAKDSQFTMRAVAEAVGPNALRTMELRLDGRPCSAPHTARLVSSPDNPAKMEMEWKVTLPVGTHQLSVLARGEGSDAVSEAVEVTCTATGRSVEEQPNLYVLSVGIKDYTDPQLAIPFADHDARELAATFEARGKGLFRKVESRVLVNGKATRAGLLEGLDWLRQKARPQDRVVIFYSGRGTSGERGEFRLMPYDTDGKRLAETTLAGTELKKQVAEVPGRVLLLLDAVPGGAVGRPDPREARAREALVRELADADCGASVLVSAMSHQAPLVNPVPQHGLYTAALIEGLSGHGLVDKRDWAVYLHQLVPYVADRVGKWSEGKQTPYLVAPVGARPFALSKP